MKKLWSNFNDGYVHFKINSFRIFQDIYFGAQQMQFLLNVLNKIKFHAVPEDTYLLAHEKAN